MAVFISGYSGGDDEGGGGFDPEGDIIDAIALERLLQDDLVKISYSSGAEVNKITDFSYGNYFIDDTNYVYRLQSNQYQKLNIIDGTVEGVVPGTYYGETLVNNGRAVVLQMHPYQSGAYTAHYKVLKANGSSFEITFDTYNRNGGSTTFGMANGLFVVCCANANGDHYSRVIVYDDNGNLINSELCRNLYTGWSGVSENEIRNMIPFNANTVYCLKMTGNASFAYTFGRIDASGLTTGAICWGAATPYFSSRERDGGYVGYYGGNLYYFRYNQNVSPNTYIIVKHPITDIYVEGERMGEYAGIYAPGNVNRYGHILLKPLEESYYKIYNVSTFEPDYEEDILTTGNKLLENDNYIVISSPNATYQKSGLGVYMRKWNTIPHEENVHLGICIGDWTAGQVGKAMILFY